MKKELNIAAILKEKPKKTKLHDIARNVTLLFNEIDGYENIECSLVDGLILRYTNEGRMYQFPTGMEVLKPSAEMRDWIKFAWKKGDVLTDNTSTICMFDSWANEDYTEFNAKYTLHLIASTNAENEVCKTNDFVPVLKDDDKQSYLATAETYFNVNLTKGSLEIEHPKQPEFKDGDIVTYECDVDDVPSNIFILRGVNKSSPYYSYYASLGSDGFVSLCSGCFGIFKRELRPSTDSEKQQLFDALAKEGKRWNPDTLQIEDLPKKCEFKAFDKVLVRMKTKDTWQIELFSHLSKDEDTSPYHCIYGYWKYCIPYNDQTKHLLGTTDEWKGGEG